MGPGSRGTGPRATLEGIETGRSLLRGGSRGTGPRATFQGRFLFQRDREGQVLALRFEGGFCFREGSRGTGPRATLIARGIEYKELNIVREGQALALR